MRKFGEKKSGVEYYVRPGSYGVLIENNRAAVIKSDIFDKYFLVGGGIKKSESEIEALRREALEEIGYEIEIGEKIGVATEYYYIEVHDQYVAKICNFYPISLLDKVSGDAENELLWIEKDELGELYHRSQQWIVEENLGAKIR
jgi:8-oxo-dGTP diphosphatase